MRNILKKNIGGVSLLFMLLCICTTLAAQTADEIALAKQLARQQGYSESEISAMEARLYGKTVTQTAVTEDANAIDRNDVQQQVFMPTDSNNPVQPDTAEIFGHSIFRNKNAIFIPSYNIPTPSNYKLAAGDEVVIDVWGAVVTNYTLQVSPEGSIRIPDIGPVYVNGQTMVQAEANIRDYLSKIYSGITDPTPNTFVKVSLGKIKSVTVNVVGDVVTPGTVTLPSLSTVVSALYIAQGPSRIGTVRNVRLLRGGRDVSVFDLYRFIFFGESDTNVKLEDNDVISVAPYYAVVSVEGAVKRPMKYELKENETIEDLILFSGGFTGDASRESVYVERIMETGGRTLPASLVGSAAVETYVVPAREFTTFKLKDGDRVLVRKTDGEFANKVNVTGAVWYPGAYSITDSLRSVKDLIAAAGGLKPDAYTERAYIARTGETGLPESVTMNLQNIILGSENVELESNDTLKVFYNSELTPVHTISVMGSVNAPGDFTYREGLTLGDAILMAGGIDEAATLEKVEIARRIVKEEESLDLSDTVALILHLNLLKNPDDSDTKLSPYDIVYVRRSAQYRPQQTITIEGEVNYPGSYVIEKNTVRLSDIVNKAAGFRKDAYAAGAVLTRRLTETERANLEIAKSMAMQQTDDSTAKANLSMIDVGSSYTVAINLDLAVANPGSYHDIVLRTGDVITVPKYTNMVKVSGNVYFPNHVTYKPGENYKYYVNNAGGYNKGSVKRNVFMIHMNGYVAKRGSKEFVVKPGTEIVVPKRVADPSRRGQTIASIMGMASSTASLAAMVVAILNYSK